MRKPLLRTSHRKPVRTTDKEQPERSSPTKPLANRDRVPKRPRRR
jgi:hypothetical protein